MKSYTQLELEINRRLSKSPEVQQWGSVYIQPSIMKQYKRKIVNNIISEQVYFSGIDFYESVRFERNKYLKIGFFKAIFITIGWCKS